jgi:TPR repeat protein
VAFVEGSVGSVDRTRAVELFTSACDADDAPGCFQLSNMRRRGLGLRRDRTKAAELLERACSLGMTEACTEGSPVDDAAAK